MQLTIPIEKQYWTPDLRWTGETAFILGSGPSLSKDDVELLRGRHVIVVNGSYNICPWGEVLFFMDNQWFRDRKELIKNWPGLVVSYSRVAKLELPDIVHRILTDTMPTFPTPGSPKVRHGNNSGQTGLSLAIAMGATTIVLLGFDMKTGDDGHTHCHDEYGVPGEKDKRVYNRLFIPFFRGWNADAKAIGVTILNATPGSALTEFPMIDLREFLTRHATTTSNTLGERVLDPGNIMAG